MLLEDLIEKAFSDGYEYALMEQREFADHRRAMEAALNNSIVKHNRALLATKRSLAKKIGSSGGSASALQAASRPAPDFRQLQAKRAGNPFSRASQILSGPGGMR